MNPTRFVSKWLVLPAIVALLAAAPCRADEKDEVKKKIQELDKITGDEQIRDAARKLFRDKANTVKMLKIVNDMAKLDSKQFQYNSAYILAVSASALKSYDVSLRLFGVCEKKAREVKSSKKLAEALVGQVGVLFATKKYDEAEDLCRKAIEDLHDEDLDQERIEFEESLVHAQARGGKIDEALKTIEKMGVQGVVDWYCLRLKGEVLHRADRNEESVKAYLESIEAIEKSERLKPAQQDGIVSTTRYVLSNVYIEMNQVDKAADVLKDLLKRHPDRPGFNNDLGYIWADHDMNLDEAEKLIRKAIDEHRKLRKKAKNLAPEDDKDEAAYLDSLGWVLYKKKQYAEAKKHLLEAVKDEEKGQHGEILDHLADVHMALGEKADAIKVWKQAVEQEIETKRDKIRRTEISKKLKAAQGK